MKLTNILALVAFLVVTPFFICNGGYQAQDPIQASKEDVIQPDETEFLKYLEKELELARKEAKEQEAKLAAQIEAKKELVS